jgi:hypothetical protein
MRNGADTIIGAFTGARSMWQKDVKLINGVHRLELISIGKSLVLVQDYPKGDGWNAFVPVSDDGRIDATLKAIAERCGVEIPEAAGETCANCGSANLGAFVCSDCGTSTLLTAEQARS